MSSPVFFTKKEIIGNLLVKQGKIQPQQLERALAHQATVGRRIGEILVSLGFISEEDLVQAMASGMDLGVYAPATGDEFLPLDISKPFHKEHPFALIRRQDKLYLVTSDPLDSDIVSSADMVAPGPFDILLTTEPNIKKITAAEYDLAPEEEETSIVGTESEIDRLKDMASEAPVIKYVNNLIDTAINRRASDIHLEPLERGLLIRLRVDGILHDFEIPPAPMQPAIVSRTKLLANLDIAERRVPQDGKISMRISGKEIDLRVSTMPTVHGEGVVVRLLEKGNIVLDLGHLGMKPEMESRFLDLVSMPNGIFLATGPTGSGKTTTLYCALNHVNTGMNKIITLEDPVEYQLEGINQIQVRPDIGLTFARGLRSIVRQDPDVIMVGEIRDADTAEIAVQSSLTGHLVFSTLHTNDAISSIMRLVDIGIERFLIAASLRGILGQRLVRCICQNCRSPRGMISEFLETRTIGEDFRIYKGSGCHSCSQTGYTGRKGIFELLAVNDAMSRAISQGSDLGILKKVAADAGFRSMFEDGLDKVRDGVTTLAEVVRVSKGMEHELL